MIVCPWKDLKRYAAVIPGLEEAIEKIDALQSWEPAVYPLENGKFIVQQGTTKPWEDAKLEAHRAYLDVQYILEGKDTVGWAPVDTLTPEGEFDTEKDYCLYTGENTPVEIKAGYCYVVYPEDAHAPNTHLSVPSDYKKIVVKLKA
jgi:YhcH/YjgK/YiaL family protein